MASGSRIQCDPRSEKSVHHSCVDCSTDITYKKCKIYQLNGNSKQRLRELLEEKTGQRIFETDLLCNTCYQKLHKKLKSCETTVEISSDKEEETEDETELRIKCVKGSEKKCLICGDKDNIRFTNEIRLSIYEKCRKYVPKSYRNNRICSMHQKDYSLKYKDLIQIFDT